MAFTRIVNVEDSSQISRIMYDPENQKASIRFKNGDTYIYETFGPTEFGRLVSAPSVGQYFSFNIRNFYTGQKIG